MAESAGGGSASEPPAQPIPSFAISGTPVNKMGAGVGRNKQTSGVFLVLFSTKNPRGFVLSFFVGWVSTSNFKKFHRVIFI